MSKSDHHPRDLVEKTWTYDGVPQSQRKSAKTVQSSRPARTVTVNLSESPLSWLHSRGHLTDRQYDAGEKMRNDWERANLSPNITMRWDEAPISGGRRAAPETLDATERQIAAKRRFDEALDFLGRDLSDICWRVICAGDGVPAAEKALGWPSRSGKVVLKIALDRLGDYYHLPG